LRAGSGDGIAEPVWLRAGRSRSGSRNCDGVRLPDWRILLVDPSHRAHLSCHHSAVKEVVSMVQLVLNGRAIRAMLLIEIKSFGPKIAYLFLRSFPSTEMKDEC
jgi:hypothetical protein